MCAAGSGTSAVEERERDVNAAKSAMRAAERELSAADVEAMLRVEQASKREAQLDSFASRRLHLAAIIDNPYASDYEREAAATAIRSSFLLVFLCVPK